MGISGKIISASNADHNSVLHSKEVKTSPLLLAIRQKTISAPCDAQKHVTFTALQGLAPAHVRCARSVAAKQEQ